MADIERFFEFEPASIMVSWLHSDTRAECPPGEIGGIWVSGPSVAQGYWGCPAETAETFRAQLRDTGAGPFLRTGGLGFVAASL